MGTEFFSANSDSDIHLVDVDVESLPCMLCAPSCEERFNSMRNLLEHFTNDHMAIHLYGCHLCNQAMSSYPDFVMHECFTGKEESELGDPKFAYCHASLVCSDCGIQFLLNGTVANKQSMHEYLSLMAVHNSVSMKLVCIYSIGVLKKDQDHFYMNYTSKMTKFDFLCKTDTELKKCCPSLCPKYYDQDSVGLATFAHTSKQSECLELINMNSRIKSVSIDDILSPVIQTETKLRSIMQNGLNGKHKNHLMKNPFNIADENNVLFDDSEKGFSIRLCVQNFETCIPRDILKGFMFERDIYECSSCLYFFDGLNSVKDHWKECSLKNASLTKFDPLNPRCVRLVFNKNIPPSKRVTCSKCSNQFCSFIGLRLHYARNHSIFITDDHEKISNKKDIKTYGEQIITKSINEYLSNESNKFKNKSRSDSLSSDESLIQPSRSNRSKWGVIGRAGRLSQENKPKRVSFTRVEHKRREGSTNLEEILSSQGSNIERSLTPASSSSEMPRRRPNATNLGVEEEGWRSSRRSRVSKSPNVVEDHNSSTGSMIDNSQQRTRPRSERAKQMELKKQEKARREKEDEEKEDQEREKRRRRKLADQNEGIQESTSNTNSQPPVLINQTLIGNNESPKTTFDETVTKKRPRLEEPKPVITEDVEVIDLSDDSDENQKDVVVRAQPKNVSRNSSQQSNLSEHCSLFCFFCGQDIQHTVEFVHHMERHTDVFHRCPVCIVLSHKEHQFKHVLHVVDHIIEKHIRKDDDHCLCPFCHKDFGPLLQIYPLYACFQHILLSCDRSKYCMLCLATNNDSNVHKLRENFVTHCNEKHTFVYNKFICSKCMTGFPTKFLFIEHTCSYVHRCACDISRPFPNKQAFFEHERTGDDRFDHYPIKPIDGSRGIYLPNSYRKQLKTMEIELCKKRKINYPERNDYVLFFQKYPHLFLAFEPFSSLVKNLAIIKVPPIEGQSKEPFNLLDILNQNQNGQLDMQKSWMMNGEQADNRPSKTGVKHLKKKKRKHVNPEVQLQNAKKVEPAKCLRSDVVWKEAAKYDGEYDEVADLLEDLILSVADNSTMFANGLFKPTRSSHRRIMPKPQIRHQFVTPTPISQQNLVARVTQPTQSTSRMFQDLSAVDSSPLMQRILNAGTSIANPYSNNSPSYNQNDDSRMGDESDDDEIEVIGEFQGPPRVQQLPQLIQTKSKTLIMYPSQNRIVNISQNPKFSSQQPQFSTILNKRSKTSTNNNGAVQDWINNYQQDSSFMR